MDCSAQHTLLICEKTKRFLYACIFKYAQNQFRSLNLIFVGSSPYAKSRMMWALGLNMLPILECKTSTFEAIFVKLQPMIFEYVSKLKSYI